ncbi:multidrug DMT transporter permease [Halothiobacillus diazotrophicus]|uniref:Multidrug DMT transporter permease n=1 Tax=Halothiobacillus diazotrophicus TaxID=1860122 RepID=A0A191ZG17_9GAMM|nr:DMT family transporter [Halothiobacillus diazotrophicus]ANJ66813.1 multidrug DMT transporter permease [Halothiobacillus diazotrophicus]
MPVNLVLLLLTTSVFFWGVNFALAGPVLADLPPLWAAALRFILAAAIMLAIAAYRGDQLLKLLRQHAPVHLLLGVLGIVGFNWFFFHAMQQTSGDNGALIMATNPLLTTLLAALLLRERASVRQLIAIPIALLGVSVVITAGDLSRLAQLDLNRGDVLMLFANLNWALFNVATKRFMPKEAPMGNTAWMMVMGALILTVMALASGETFTLPGAHAGFALIVMTLGGTILAYLFWGMGVRNLGAGRAALFLNLVPVFAMLVSGAMGIAPTVAQITGGLIVLAGVTFAMMPMRTRVAA